MDQVCCVIDFDGFRVSGQFLVREFGYIGINSSTGSSVRFDLRPYEEDISRSEWKTIDYVTKHITGLPFHPMENEETAPLRLLKCKVIAVHDLYRTDDKNVVAYKGGNVEKDLLQQLNIPYLNLEDYGCPKFDILKNQQTYENCGYHIRDKHCPLAEVTAFRNWMLENI
ncbi:hypothetical protein AVEN_243958-1 [Araneus ventricosus]|uniref:Uncharacterized protein n=1 Tax=Araneus ventricosus TaxID=182803 RepID=A0A4Y2SV79_ARAVE|nr:hypothetical protein AVEN_193278-1 [Araneus ventricosus]GBN91814.1 hypothetical protein AVEN_243958-1 [Araneus ventricosus]